MDIRDIVQRIEARTKEMGTTVTTVAQEASSESAIRNWQRAVRDGRNVAPRIDTLTSVAKVLGVDPDWLIYGDDGARPDIPAPLGLAEEAAPFVMTAHPVQPDDPGGALRAVFGPAARTPASYLAGQDQPAFAINRGDVLVCDLARLPNAGELALVRVDHGAEAVTLIRRYLPPFLLSGTMDTIASPLRVDDPAVTIRCVVVGSIRGIGEARQ